MVTQKELKALGALIKEARKRKGWIQDELAAASGVGKGYISDIERGYVHSTRGIVVPSDDVLDALAKALDVPTSQFHKALNRVQEIERIPADERRHLAGLRHLPPHVRQTIDEIVELYIPESDELPEKDVDEE